MLIQRITDRASRTGTGDLWGAIQASIVVFSRTRNFDRLQRLLPARLAVLKRVERDRERDEKPPIDIVEARLEFEHVAVADRS